MFKIALILGLIAAIFQYTEATCGVCNTNGVACVGANEFHLCTGGQPNKSLTYRCPNPTEICTKYGPICMDTTTTKDLKPACGDTSNCGICEGVVDGGYTCTSRNTYTICLGETLSEIRLACPEYKMCDVGKAALAEYPCVPQCEEDSIRFCDLQEAIDAPATTTTTAVPVTTTTTEDNPTTMTVTTSESISTTSATSASTVTTTEEDDLTTTTIFAPTPTTPATSSSPITTESTSTMTPTTSEPTTVTTTTTEISTTQSPTTTTEIPTTTVNPAEVLCSQQTAVGRYAYPNDNTCRRYINCYVRNGVMHSTTMDCPGQTYFDASTTLCGEAKPQGCI